MKKIFSLLVAALILAAPTMVEAQSAYSKQLQKQRKKEYKAKVKKLNKEGWQVYGTSHTLEVALLTHYDKLPSWHAMGV